MSEVCMRRIHALAYSAGPGLAPTPATTTKGVELHARKLFDFGHRQHLTDANDVRIVSNRAAVGVVDDRPEKHVPVFAPGDAGKPILLGFDRDGPRAFRQW